MDFWETCDERSVSASDAERFSIWPAFAYAATPPQNAESEYPAVTGLNPRLVQRGERVNVCSSACAYFDYKLFNAQSLRVADTTCGARWRGAWSPMRKCCRRGAAGWTPPGSGRVTSDCSCDGTQGSGAESRNDQSATPFSSKHGQSVCRPSCWRISSQSFVRTPRAFLCAKVAFWSPIHRPSCCSCACCHCTPPGAAAST